MGPASLRTAGIIEALAELGHAVAENRDLAPDRVEIDDARYAPAHHVGEVAGWTRAIRRAVAAALAAGRIPVLLGGDHSVAAGSLAALGDVGRLTHVLWLDAHPDFHTLTTTSSGNLHGCPVALACGQEGAEVIYGEPIVPLDPARITMIGLRSVDPAEKRSLRAFGVTVHDMRDVDEHGMGSLVRAAIRRAADAKARLHVSLDVDFLDPDIAPAVGTTVPGGATIREAHLAMELLAESGLVGSLDLVELNPFLDEFGRTAKLMVDLAASVFGRTIMDRPTQSW
jgi:arginase